MEYLVTVLRLILTFGLLFSGVLKAEAQCGYTDVAVGGAVACAIRADDSTIDCWGVPQSGGAPENVPPGGAFLDLGDGVTAFCGVKTDHSLACWGNDDTLILTNKPAGTNYDFVDGSEGSMCAIKTDDSVVCWGDEVDMAVVPANPAGSFSKLTCGEAACCGVLTSGALSCFGDDGDLVPEPSGTNWVDVSGDGYSMCAYTSAGAMTCWGNPDAGTPSGIMHAVGVDDYPRPCGINDSCDLICLGDYSSIELAPPAATGIWDKLTGGRNNVCGISTGGNVACWGSNETLMCLNGCDGGSNNTGSCATNADCGGLCRLTCSGGSGFHDDAACANNADCTNTCNGGFVCTGTATVCLNNADCSSTCGVLECAPGLDTNASCTTNADCSNECVPTDAPAFACTDTVCPVGATTTTTTTTTTTSSTTTTLNLFVEALTWVCS